MSKVQLMGSGAFDVFCPTKRVYWRPVTATTVIKVGQPICYNSDSVQDHKERTADPAHLGLTQDTYAEGEQEFTGRLFIVEEPLTANLHAWAGIVKSLGPEAGGDGDMIEIWIPTEGAVVPVISDQNCTLDRTIIGIRNGEAATSYPGRPIGVALETKDRSTTDGLVWMKFKNFDYQAINAGGDSAGNSLIVDDEGTTNSVLINSVSVKFNGSAIYNRVLYMVGELAGGGAGLNGMFKFRTYVSSTMTSLVQVVCGNLHLKDDGVIISGSGEYNSAFYATVETEETSSPAVLTGATVVAYQAAYYLDESETTPTNAYVLGVPAGFAANTYAWDGLLLTGEGHVGDTLSGADEASHVIGFDGDGVTRKIPVKIGSTTYYLLVGTAIQGVADA